ncbi:MAG: type II toxin-antitoxin system HigB family toxin [Bacteroidales bacterium]|nr:type II toxin-antitoxin system HigB family toxin [Bacteroidales bacterium]
MRVHLLTNNTVEKYIASNIQSRAPLESWLVSLKDADWDTPHDIKTTFNSADMLGKGSKRVVFNIGGNKYRMICQYYFGKRKVSLFINWIGKHSEYSALCNFGKQFTIDDY